MNILDKYTVSRRSIIVGAIGVGTVGGAGVSHRVYREDPTLTIHADFPSNDIVVGSDDDDVGIPTAGLSFELTYRGFHRRFIYGAPVNRPEEFDVDISIQPEFADEPATIATGTIGSGSVPNDVMSASFDSKAFAQTDLDLATHPAVSDDYAEFKPTKTDKRAVTTIDVIVTARSRSYDVCTSRTYNFTVTSVRELGLEASVGPIHEAFVLKLDDGEIRSMYIDGDSLPVEIAYRGFDDKVSNRDGEFTVSLLVRPEFADDLEPIATETIDAGETPDDTVTGIFSDGIIDVADHSAIKSEYTEFELGEKETNITALEVVVRVESDTYGVVDSKRSKVVIIMTDEEKTVISRPSPPSKPSEDDMEISIGGKVALEGEAETEPYRDDDD